MTSWDALWTQPWFWSRPWALLLLLVPLGLAAWRLRSARAERHVALRWADAELLPFATAQPPARAVWGRLLRDTLMWTLLALAAAGPRQPLTDAAGAAGPHRIAVMVLMDASAAASAAPADATLSPLEQQRLLLAALWPELSGERLGLIAYGASRPGAAMAVAQLLPPTNDPALFNHAADQARPQILAVDGAGAALPGLLDLARQRLRQQAEGEPGALLLMAGPGLALPSDLDGAALGRALRAAHLPLYGLALPGLSAEAASVLRAVAQTSGGEWDAVAAGQTGTAAWQRLYAQGMARLPASPAAASAVTAWRELYGLFLLPALVVLLVSAWPRPRAMPALLLAALFLGASLTHAPSARAAEPLPQRRAEHAAWSAWQQGRYAEAQQRYAALPGYAARMGEGAAAYRLGHYQVAAQAFHRALLLADTPGQRFAAFYDLGNATLHLPGRSLEAVQAFDAALRLRPNDAQAQRNARLARRVYETEHPPSYLVGIAKRAPPSHQSRFGQQTSDTPSQLKHHPRAQASAPLQQGAALSAQGHLSAPTGASAAVAQAAWQPPALDWAGMDKRVQLLLDARAELLAQRAALDTRAAAGAAP
ncbi:hypothetical protein [Thiomonas bhubaneswarensis]|uniref:von Willebrand factor type A domain n=1 Tax=Thiomonas bhubaneswarensis TaxID=339866 RepID=A0A0K6HV39_9BURK|nr:hypothetical protein [Thiomonas bhubaneswarensis]CUA94628.1 von Willebrand factor type A domain [Thiomonas bhubaneswarensis]